MTTSADREIVTKELARLYRIEAAARALLFDWDEAAVRALHNDQDEPLVELGLLPDEGRMQDLRQALEME